MPISREILDDLDIPQGMKATAQKQRTTYTDTDRWTLQPIGTDTGRLDIIICNVCKKEREQKKNYQDAG